MDDSFLIHLRFAGKVHPLVCKRCEERSLRDAAKRVEELIRQYNGRFDASKIDEKDILAMVAFHCSFENQQERTIEDISPLFARLEQLSIEIEKYIQSDK
jgi:hypothetical protein